jgi:hypothetical protein
MASIQNLACQTDFESGHVSLPPAPGQRVQAHASMTVHERRFHTPTRSRTDHTAIARRPRTYANSILQFHSGQAK